MGKKENQTSGAAGGQVFELTMDNPEDQDELNRQLRKPGEPNNCNNPSAARGKVLDESSRESDEMKNRTNG